MEHNKKLEILLAAKQLLEYMNKCAHTEQVPAASTELTDAIRGLQQVIEAEKLG